MKKVKKRTKDKSINDIRYATFISRLLAFVTDLFMIGMPVFLVSMIFFGYDQVNSAGGMDVIMQTQKAQDNPPSPVASIFQLLLSASIYVFLWHKSGQTPGKKMARIKVVDAKTHTQASYLQLVIRFFAYFPSFLFFGYLLMFIQKDKKALHDILSSTVVIYE